MSAPLLMRNRNYRLLFGAGVLTNLGDGMVALALPWMATLLTSDALAVAAVAAAGRLPWLLLSIPMGVVIDRTDRRKLIARADLFRAAIMGAILMLAVTAQDAQAVWVLAGLAFLLGCAEVLRDNAAQTILPALVAPADLEAANGQMWSAETLTGQFIGPPLAGLLIGIGIALPLGLDIMALLLGAGFVWLIAVAPHPPTTDRFLRAMADGIRFMAGDRPLFRLALVLGLSNFLAMATITIQVLFAQEVLGLGAATYGIILSIEALGAVAGSLLAPHLVRRFGLHPCLFLSIAVWGLGYGAIGLTSSPVVMAGALFAVLFAAMVWNVITVSWRQRRIPQGMLGRVNSIYRCFGWGSMPLGAIAGGAVVSALENNLGREMALRAPFVLAAACCLGLLLYALARLRLD